MKALAGDLGVLVLREGHESLQGIEIMIVVKNLLHLQNLLVKHQQYSIHLAGVLEHLRIRREQEHQEDGLNIREMLLDLFEAGIGALDQSVEEEGDDAVARELVFLIFRVFDLAHN